MRISGKTIAAFLHCHRFRWNICEVNKHANLPHHSLALSGLVAALWLGLSVSASAQIQVEGKPRWGFDGLVHTNEFNLLTIDVANLSEGPWKGNFTLEAGRGLSRVDIPLVQPDQFIEAYGRRRLQFLVYVPHKNEYALKWGRRPNENYDIDEPDEAGEPAIVQFTREEAVRAGVDGVATFNEAEFPTSAAGLSGLGTAILDHAPRWSDAQSQAFLEWILAGGTVHLYEETAGITPEFTGKLQALNEPSDHFALGGGMVHRHAQTAQQSAETFPKIHKRENYYPQWYLSSSLFQTLKEITRPEHNWLVIYFLAALYLLLLFPGCWLLGRKRGDYRITYGAILAIVALFSYGFRSVGARGYGESTSLNAAALVQPTSDGRAIVTMWSSLFVTSGNRYEITHPFEGNIYSTGQANESVPGFALNRPFGIVNTEIPSFSSRTLVNTGVVNDFRLAPELEPYRVEVLNTELADGVLKAFDVKLHGTTGSVDALVLHQGRLTPLFTDPQGIYSLANSGMSLAQEVDERTWRVARNYSGKIEETKEQLRGKTRPLLMAWSLGVEGPEERDDLEFPPGEVRLYVTVDLPESLYTPSFSQQQQGLVVIETRYHLE